MEQLAGVTVVSCIADILSALCLGSPEVQSQAAWICRPEHWFNGLLGKREQEGLSGGFAYPCDRMQDLPLVLVESRKTDLFFPSIPVESWCAPERSGLDGERVIWQQDVQLARVFCPELSPRVRSISCQIYLFYFNLAIDLSDFCLELHVPFWFWTYSLQYPPSPGKKKAQFTLYLMLQHFLAISWEQLLRHQHISGSVSIL